MSEHYSGNDPETGCALLILAALVVIAVAILLLWLALR
jgi:hypothetical protein